MRTCALATLINASSLKISACGEVFSSAKIAFSSLPLSFSFCTGSTQSSSQFASENLARNRCATHSRNRLSGHTKTMSMLNSDAGSSSFKVAQFPCLSDNYGYLIHDETTGETAAIDTPCSETYLSELGKRGWKLTHIFNTHHHSDHAGGNLSLKQAFGDVVIYGPAVEKDKIPGINVAVGGGDRVKFGKSEATVIDVGGHTVGHIAYHFPGERKLFAGDALFALGCGRMFEGTPSQFWASLERLRLLPDETTVYCAHEYTESNAMFALSVEPGNEELQSRVKLVKELRSRREPTVPSNLGEEKRTNPFLRVESEEIRKNVGAKEEESAASVFGKVRLAKDTFRG